jgi:hypothetical protein
MEQVYCGLCRIWEGGESNREREKSDYLSEIHAGSLKDWFVNSFLYYMEAGTIVTLGNANYPLPSQIIIQHRVLYRMVAKKTVLNMTPQESQLTYIFMLHHELQEAV